MLLDSSTSHASSTPRKYAVSPFQRSWQTYATLPGHETRVAFWPIDESEPQQADLYDLGMHAWAARQVFRLNPGWLLDVGSGKPYCTILSQFCAVTTLDIRPWRCQLTGLEVAEGNVLSLPYEDGDISYLSCLSVVEHVGLGRYGDALDPLGSVKALAELSRVLAPGGSLILAVPISHTPGLLYNAHRIFQRDQLLVYLPGFRVERETCLYPELGPPERVSELGEWSYCMWCAALVKEAL